MSIARSSTCEFEKTHCPGAAKHQDDGTPRDRAEMAVGTAVHHLVYAASMRPDGQTADVAIDEAAVSLVGEGRSFEGGPVEHLRMEDVDTARDFALNFLDRDMIERGGVDWMEAEVSVDIDRHFKRVERGLCQCGHHERDHDIPAEVCRAPALSDEHRGSTCVCLLFRPAAMWRQTLDLAARYQDEIDGEEVAVGLIKDYKGGNCSDSWFTLIQGKGAAVTAVALFPDVDIIQRELESYMPWGGRYKNVLDLRSQEDLDTLEDYRRAIEVAARGHALRQGKSPDELAQPGAGCSAGFGGCPFLMVCKPFALQWQAVEVAWGGTAPVATEAWASMYALAKAATQESGKHLRRALKTTDEVLTVDGLSVVGWRQKAAQKVTANAAMLLSREWAEVMLRLEQGSAVAQARQSEIEAVLANMFPGRGGSGDVKRLVKRLSEVIGREAADVLEAQCLEDDSGRMLSTWKAGKKKGTADADLVGVLKESIAAPKPAPDTTAADRKREHEKVSRALLSTALKESVKDSKKKHLGKET